MADPEATRTKKVSKSAIDEIRKLGMSKAISRYTSGEGSPEFRTAVERYYSPQRLKAASKNAPKSTSKSESTPESKPEPKPVPMPKSAPAAAGRRTKSTAEKVLGRKNAKAVGDVTKPIGRILGSIGSSSKGISGSGVKSIGKALGINNPFKPRKRK